jgi:hypothetical protein
MEPLLEDRSGERRVSNTLLGREGPQLVEVVLIEAKSDLLRTRGTDVRVEIFELVGKLLEAVLFPEVTLFLV